MRLLKCIDFHDMDAYGHLETFSYEKSIDWRSCIFYTVQCNKVNKALVHCKVSL